MDQEFCDGCEGKIELEGVARSSLYCRTCKTNHVVCFECLFNPLVHGFIPPPEICPVGGYWARCPIPILVGDRKMPR